MTILLPAGSGLAKPRLAFWNFVPDATMTVTSETTGFEKENLSDYRISTFWKPTATGTNTVHLDFGTATFINYFALYAHNVGINGDGVIYVEHSPDDVNWTGVVTFGPAGTEAIYQTFAGVSKRYWRVRFATPTHRPLVGVLFLGEDVACERGLRVGFSPPKHARATKVMNSRAQGGAFLGRSVVYQGSAFTFDQDPASEDFFESIWQYFVKIAEVQPFFLLWNPDQHPLDAAFCLSDGNPGAAQYTQNQYLGATVKVTAWVE